MNPDTTTAAHLIPSSGTNSLTEEDEQMLRNAAAEYYGADLEDISLASLILDSCSPSAADGGGGAAAESSRSRSTIAEAEEQSQFRIDLGYSELWRRLVSDGNLDVRLGQAVQSITRTDSKNICVTTNAQVTLNAERIILTVPLALLKENIITFRPELSRKKQ